jgi:hypothetical protein
VAIGTGKIIGGRKDPGSRRTKSHSGSHAGRPVEIGDREDVGIATTKALRHKEELRVEN